MLILLILEQHGVNIVSCNPAQNFYVAIRVSSMRSMFSVRFSVTDDSRVKVVRPASILNLSWPKFQIWLFGLFVTIYIYIYIYIYIHTHTVYTLCMQTLMSGYAYTG